MARIKVIADAIAELLREMDNNLTVYTEPPGSVDTPAAIVLLAPGDPDTTMGRGSDDMTFNIDMFTSIGTQGMENLYAYLDGAGDRSVIEAFTADPTLGGAVDFAVVSTWDKPNRATIGETEYYHVEFVINVGARGLS